MLTMMVWFAGWMAGFGAVADDDLLNKVEHKFADNNGVRIHYVALGKGPLVLLIHGFPDFCYGWRHQMSELANDYRVVAMDLRGYNQSDKPRGADNYDMSLLVGDAAAVIRAEGHESATVVGHDWGGAIAWSMAMQLPDMVDRLIVVNLLHLRGWARELANNPEQHANAQYARNFQKEGSHLMLNAERLARTPSGGAADAKVIYVEAFNNSDFEAMLNYYKRNYPREPYEENVAGLPMVECPVLQFHGLKDTTQHHHGLNNTWEWLAKDYTLVTIPDAGHWSHHDAADLVTDTMKWWLAMRH